MFAKTDALLAVPNLANIAKELVVVRGQPITESVSSWPLD